MNESREALFYATNEVSAKINYWNIKLRGSFRVPCVSHVLFSYDSSSSYAISSSHDFNKQFELLYDEIMRCSPGNSFSEQSIGSRKFL